MVILFGIPSFTPATLSTSDSVTDLFYYFTTGISLNLFYQAAVNCVSKF